MLKNQETYTKENLTLLRQRDSRGFSWLYDNYGNTLLCVIFKIVNDHAIAENLLQDTFVKIWRNIEDFDIEKGALFTWIFNIARNTAIDYCRSKAHHQSRKNQNLDNLVYLEHSYYTQPNVNTIGVSDIVQRLDKEYREVIDLVYFNGFTQEEASEVLNIPLGTVKTRVRIAIRELRKMI